MFARDARGGISCAMRARSIELRDDGARITLESTAEGAPLSMLVMGGLPVEIVDEVIHGAGLRVVVEVEP